MVEIRHVLPGRVRLKFHTKLSKTTKQCLKASFEYCFPQYFFKYTIGQYGVLITSIESLEILDSVSLKNWFENFFNGAAAAGPQLPPTRLEQFNRQARHITAQSMIVLAILGWILPILPGTPFFLVAWALGWRPPGSKHSVSAN